MALTPEAKSSGTGSSTASSGGPFVGDRLGGGQSAGEGRRLYAGNHPPDMALGPYQFHVCL